MSDSDLIRFLQDRLPEESLLDLFAPATDGDTDYARVLERVIAKVPELRDEAERNRARVETRYWSIADEPAGRQATVLKNSPPSMLLALTRQLLEQSFNARTDLPDRSLQLARLAVVALEGLERSRYLGPEALIDLRVEVLACLGNALRVTSDFAGARVAFTEAEQLLEMWKCDPLVRADFLSRLAALRFSEAKAPEAVAALDEEIQIRERCGDKPRLGIALIDRGVVASVFDDLDTACEYLSRGAKLVDRPVYMILALQPLADRLARDGYGFKALKVVWMIQGLCKAGGHPRVHWTRARWAEGIAYRGLGQLDEAHEALTDAHRRLVEDRQTFRAALASLDLAAVHAARGETFEVKTLAEEAYRVFQAEGLDQRALAAFLVFYKAAMAEELSERLAIRVVEFLNRHSLDRELRFEEAEA